jgi:nucleoside-diphosphate-sugar epimerase
MNLLIGGAGFVGSTLEKELVSSKVLDKSGDGVEYCDITKPETLENKISGDDRIVLLAAEHRDDVTPISKYYDTNVQGTQNVLKAYLN